MIKTGSLCWAANAICRNNCCIGAELPTIAFPEPVFEFKPVRTTFVFASARLRMVVTSSRSNGLGRYSKAPSSTAETAVDKSPWAVISSTGASVSCLICGSASMPSIPGSRTSSTMTSNDNLPMCSSACSAVADVVTSHPRSFNSAASASQIDFSSSTTSACLVISIPVWVSWDLVAKRTLPKSSHRRAR